MLPIINILLYRIRVEKKDLIKDNCKNKNKSKIYSFFTEACNINLKALRGIEPLLKVLTVPRITTML